MLEAHRQSHAQALVRGQATRAERDQGDPAVHVDAARRARRRDARRADAGAGAINAPAAIAAARAIDASTALGDDWFAGTLPRFSIYDGEAWALNAVDHVARHADLGRHAPRTSPLGVDCQTSIGASRSSGTPTSCRRRASCGPQPQLGANIVWGFDLVGTETGDQTFTWGEVEDPLRTVWADLAAIPTGGRDPAGAISIRLR